MKNKYRILNYNGDILKIPIKLYNEIASLLKIFIYSDGEEFLRRNYSFLFSSFVNIYDDDIFTDILQKKEIKENEKRKNMRKK